MSIGYQVVWTTIATIMDLINEQNKNLSFLSIV